MSGDLAILLRFYAIVIVGLLLVVYCGMRFAREAGKRSLPPNAAEIILAVRRLKGDELGLVMFILKVRDRVENRKEITC